METPEVFYSNLEKCTTKDNFASKLIISVITICGSLGSPIDLLNIFDYYMEEGSDSFELSYVPNSKKTKTEKNKAFYNCLNVTFYYKDINSIESKIAAKVFPNGSIQLPGCRTIDAVNQTPVILFNFIKNIAKKIKNRAQIIKNPELFCLNNVRIVMINSNFSFEKGILQERLKDIINDRKFDGSSESDPKLVWRLASFQPEKYSGINIRYLTKKCRDTNTDLKTVPIKKIDGQISILIFRSGKVTITGAKNSIDLLASYNSIVDIVREFKDYVFYTPR
jgi:TATA-box binding protein (TBP) (component of TFIID and TFIIIB)